MWFELSPYSSAVESHVTKMITVTNGTGHGPLFPGGEPRSDSTLQSRPRTRELHDEDGHRERPLREPEADGAVGATR
jgi:hypothetical protein